MIELAQKVTGFRERVKELKSRMVEDFLPASPENRWRQRVNPSSRRTARAGLRTQSRSGSAGRTGRLGPNQLGFGSRLRKGIGPVNLNTTGNCSLLPVMCAGATPLNGTATIW